MTKKTAKPNMKAAKAEYDAAWEELCRTMDSIYYANPDIMEQYAGKIRK
jgi:hypothetical protein